jgi:hypothetical protein
MKLVFSRRRFFAEQGEPSLEPGATSAKDCLDLQPRKAFKLLLMGRQVQDSTFRSTHSGDFTSRSEHNIGSKA